MFWLVYILASIIICHLVSYYFKSLYTFIFPTLITLLITPAQIDRSTELLAPSIYTFFFNIIFEGDYSLTVLRPLVITIPTCIILLTLFNKIRRRFF